MAWLAFIRHAKTDWNRQRWLQGRTDIPIDAHSGQRLCHLQTTRLCVQLTSARWFSSPLQRARQTALALSGGAPIETAAAIIETNWGGYEGLPLQQLKTRIQQDNLMPCRGLDLCPPNGESARMVRDRLAAWLQTVECAQENMVVVSHKGVIRCALSLATGWDMSTPYPVKIDWGLPQLFAFRRAGRGTSATAQPTHPIRLVRLNLSWDQAIEQIPATRAEAAPGLVKTRSPQTQTR